MEKKLPVRLCIACRAQKPKKELIRFVKTSDGNISLDFTGKKSGRGAYICNSSECINKCIKGRMLNKSFDMDISSEVYENLLKEYEQHKD